MGVLTAVVSATAGVSTSGCPEMVRLSLLGDLAVSREISSGVGGTALALSIGRIVAGGGKSHGTPISTSAVRTIARRRRFSIDPYITTVRAPGRSRPVEMDCNEQYGAVKAKFLELRHGVR
jgi:hypothetical protein